VFEIRNKHIAKGWNKENIIYTSLWLLLKINYVDKGVLGIKSGKGFYSYPNPKCQEGDFLTLFN